jgi:menaquinone-dependent protoporphyrinogen oxidase
MPRVQVVYASRHGGTAGIAERIGEVLRRDGLDTVVVDAASLPDPSGFDAYVVGSGVYIGSWLKEGVEYLERNQSALAARPVWLFSSGPIPNASTQLDASDLLSAALGPTDGPGSGGHKRIDALSAAIRARGHRVFLGAYDPNDPPKTMQERIIRLLPAAKNTLPAGDFRDWDAIEAWSHEIAAQLETPVAVG